MLARYTPAMPTAPQQMRHFLRSWKFWIAVTLILIVAVRYPRHRSALTEFEKTIQGEWTCTPPGYKPISNLELRDDGTFAYKGHDDQSGEFFTRFTGTWEAEDGVLTIRADFKRGSFSDWLRFQWPGVEWTHRLHEVGSTRLLVSPVSSNATDEWTRYEPSDQAGQ